MFCLYFGLKPFPASSRVISLYSQFLSRSVTPQTVRNYLSGVKVLHLIAGFEFPSLQDYEIRITLKGIDRLAKHTPIRAPPILPEILIKIHEVCDFTDPWEATLFCSFLFAFFLMARIPNIVPHSAASFDPSVHLCRGDIYRGKEGLLVLFKWTKTIQYQERRLFLPLLPIPDSPLCPVMAFDRMCSLSPAPDGAPAFAQCSSRRRVQAICKHQFI